MKNKNNNLKGEIFLILLQALFLILKLTGLIDWSWWLVFAPVLVVFSTMILLISLTVLGMIYRRFFKDE
jgi:hypothetical protein